ncbi:MULTISPECIES: DUF6396 domain-containing protein, partial [unclassified Neisseria]|uniref:DUF6396 domain-containing protein n=1 Tax=unclassified Neisseria TaxID=2623750 RepID=UPI002665C6FD
MIGELLTSIFINMLEGPLRDSLSNLAAKFYHCSASKKHRFPSIEGASKSSSIYEVRYNQLGNAMRAAQEAIRGGGYQGAFVLKGIFNGTYQQYMPDGTQRNISYIIQVDKERSRRYGIIESYLSKYPGILFKPELHVQEIDDIVPLPPAPLPEWDGKLAIQRFVEGNAPPKPDD